MSDTKTALVLFAHGSRDPAWAKPIEEIAARCRAASPDIPVVSAYLELMTPGLEQAVAALISQHPGLKSIHIFPVFLGMGRHAREDLPELSRSLQQQYPSMEFIQLPSAGENPQVLQAIAGAASAALAR